MGASFNVYIHRAKSLTGSAGPKNGMRINGRRFTRSFPDKNFGDAFGLNPPPRMPVTNEGLSGLPTKNVIIPEVTVTGWGGSPRDAKCSRGLF